MKSVHITNYYHKTSGGISTAYNHLLDAADRHKRYVRLIVPGEESSVEEVGEYGRIYYIKAGFSPIFDKRYRLMLPWKTYLLEGAPIKTILRDEKPDIIEIGEKYTLSLMAGLLRKYILTVGEKRPMLVHLSCERMDDNMRSFVGEGRLTRWFARRYVANYILPMFDFHLANSDYTAQEFCDSVAAERDPRRSELFFNFCWRLLRAPQQPLDNRIFINQCGVDNVTFNAGRKNVELRDRFKSEYGIADDAKLLLYAGRISPEKNIGLLLDTMRSLSSGHDGHSYKLLVAGGGPSYDDLASKAGPDVVMIGHLTDKENLANLFANCDAFVHPNPREPFGITPLEAMASGLPVVAPNSGGLLSYASDDNAWLTNPTGEAFAEAIRSIFADPQRQEEKVANAVETAANYDWDSSTDSIFEAYDLMYETFTKNRALFDYREPAKVDFAGNLTAC